MIYVLPNIPESLSRAICADLIGSLPSPADDTPEQLALRDFVSRSGAMRQRREWVARRPDDHPWTG
jgi:hypothetical protein